MRWTCLLEGVPGLAKPYGSNIVNVYQLNFSEYNSPDMLPGDVTGTQIFNPRGQLVD